MNANGLLFGAKKTKELTSVTAEIIFDNPVDCIRRNETPEPYGRFANLTFIARSGIYEYKFQGGKEHGNRKEIMVAVNYSGVDLLEENPGGACFQIGLWNESKANVPPFGQLGSSCKSIDAIVYHYNSMLDQFKAVDQANTPKQMTSQDLMKTWLKLAKL